MTLVLGAWSDGLILSLLALGVFVSFRIFRFPDITVDGSITLGASVGAVLLTQGLNPVLATLVSFFAGMLAGAATGTLHTKFKINPLLSGILVMTALYSINLRVMGRSNLPFGRSITFATYAEHLGSLVAGSQDRISILGWEVSPSHVALLSLSFIITFAVGLGLYAFFRTDLGTAMRATGDNDQMIRALGVNVDTMMIGGMALSNGLVALAGSLYAQVQGFSDVQMGIGMVVIGLASVIIGEALVGGQNHLGLAIIGTVMGSILYRLLVALALRAGLNPNDMKLFTAIFVFFALILPDVLKWFRSLLNRPMAASVTLEKANATH